MDIMAIIAETLNPPWNYFLITIGLLLVLVPKFLDIRRELVNSSKDRRDLIRKKEKLQILKLQFEIEALRRQHDLPVSESVSSLLTPEVVEIPAPELPSEEVEIPAPEVPAEEEVKRVMSAKASLGSFLLAVAQVVLAFFGVIFTIEIFFIPFITVREGGSYAVTIFGSLFSLLVTWGIYNGYMRLRRLRKRIRHVSYRDREEPHNSSPLPPHAAYGSVLRESADPRKRDCSR